MSFGISPTSSLSRNPKIYILGFTFEISLYSLLDSINSIIYLLIVPFEGLFEIKMMSVMKTMYLRFPHCFSSYTMLFL